VAIIVGKTRPYNNCGRSQKNDVDRDFLSGRAGLFILSIIGKDGW
jgi:hypothetical protein